MRTKVLIIFGCLALSLTLFTGTSAAKRTIEVTSSFDGKTVHSKFSSGDNYALIIGINEYRHHPNLKTAVNDMEGVARLLEEKYFFDPKNITLIKNREATKTRILSEFRDLVAQRVQKGDNVFIYYAGHGWFDDILKTGYWVTTEATKDSATFLENNLIYKYIIALDNEGVQHVLLVSDSCFAGSFTKEHRAIETEIDDRYFREKYAKPSRSILASGGVEYVADVGKDGHSIFAYYFLKTLRDNSRPYLSAKQVGMAVEELVTRNSDQTPVSRYIHGAGDEGGQFFFINRLSGQSDNGGDETKKLEQELKRLQADRKKVETKMGKLASRLKKEELRKKIAEEKKKAEEAEKKLQKLAAVWKSKDGNVGVYTPDPVYREIKRDGQYIAYNNGVVYDSSTGLEWYVGPDENTTWYKAKSWTEGLSMNGGWRMPTRKELKSLYKKGAGTRNMTPLLKTRGWGVWSGKTKGSSSAWYFGFDFGFDDWFNRFYSSYSRGFAVRSRPR